MKDDNLFFTKEFKEIATKINDQLLDRMKCYLVVSAMNSNYKEFYLEEALAEDATIESLSEVIVDDTSSYTLLETFPLAKNYLTIEEE